MPSRFRLSTLLAQALFGLLLAVSLAISFAASAAADLKKCDCRDCLKLMKLSTLAERRHYGERWPKTEAELQKEIERYNTKPDYQQTVDAQGGGLFCSLWSTLEDELSLVRDLQIKETQTKIYDGHKKCLGAVGGATDPVTCEIDQLMTALNEINAPCKEIHLAILAHELVHAADCQARKEQPDWLSNKGSSCREAFKGKPTPSPDQLIAYAKSIFSTELHAHLVESQVLSLLSNELAKQCKKDEYSADLPNSYPDARDFLKRAREYKVVLP